MDTELTGSFSKLDEERQIALGWAYQAVDKSGEPIQDHSGDVLDASNLEDVAFDYVLHSREGDVMHKGPAVAHLVESVVVTPEKLEKMGIEAEAAPVGWWVGLKIDDAGIWKRVKSGELTMFSIAGKGRRESLD